MTEFSIQHLVEATLYVDDLDRAEGFFREVLGLELVGKEQGRHVFFRAGQDVLLLFDPDATRKPSDFPAPRASGPGHAALGIPAEAVDYWRSRLQEHGIQIEKDATWPKGGRSLYFRDPAAWFLAASSKVTSQGLQSISLLLDFRLSTEAEAAKDGQRRTPSLKGVLKQESRYDGRQGKETTIKRTP